MPKQIKLFDAHGCDIIPIQMITTIQKEEPSCEEFSDIHNELLFGDMVSIRDIFAFNYGAIDNGDK